ncbi:c-type cytochrome, partial [uncultured Thiothrix sp.]|uniref:c-type cytochrome n=1 Tax=uncultured Thiothrix sp. TaxID=223185 RepID=UPI00260DB9BA
AAAAPAAAAPAAAAPAAAAPAAAAPAAAAPAAAAPAAAAPAAAAPAAANPTEQTSSSVSADGEKVYRSICFSCHDVGIANSPKLGDKTAWAPRIAAGKDSLYNHALNGLNAMPAKGGNPALSDADIKAAVDWMAAQAQ